jgi:RNA polymerase sigma-70 factor (ECF subfamily)
MTPGPAAQDRGGDAALPGGIERLDALTDCALAQRAQLGSNLCFEELVRRYQVPLMRFVHRKVGKRSDAEDIVQDSFLRAFRKLDRYRDAWSFRTWIYTITYRIALNHVRQARRSDQSMSLDEKSIGGRHDARAEVAEERSALWATAKKVLTDEQFTTIWLHYVEEMSSKQIAKITGRTGVGVRATLFRARRRLETHLAPGEQVAVGTAEPRR